MADTKLTGLTEVSIPALGDYGYLVDDPLGTPLSRRVVYERLLALAHAEPSGRLGVTLGALTYAPVNENLTPSATSTANDTVDFAAAHGWSTGSVVVSVATIGGLSLGTTYYINAVDTDTISFHLTVAAAFAGTSKVDLTANITQVLMLFGMATDTLRYLPRAGTTGLLTVFDGTRLVLKTFSALALTLSGLTASRNYDVFVDDDAATLSLSSAWNADNITRTDALGTEGPLIVLGSDHTKLWLGTIRALEAAATESSRLRQFVSNAYHMIPLRLGVEEFTASWTYVTTAAIRQARAQTTNRVEVVAATLENTISLTLQTMAQTSVASSAIQASLGLDSTTVFMASAGITNNYASRGVNDSTVLPITSVYSGRVPLGYHAYNWLEKGDAAATITYLGYFVGVRRCGISGWVMG